MLTAALYFLSYYTNNFVLAAYLKVFSLLFVVVFTVIANWKIYGKAGQTRWAAIVPIYSQCTYFEISWGSALWFLLTIVPIANMIVYIITPFKLARAFGRGVGFGFGLLLLPVVFSLILAFDNSTYHGIPGKMPPYPAPEAAPQTAEAAQLPLQPAQPAEPPRPFKFCPDCGTQAAGGCFCRSCGRRLD